MKIDSIKVNKIKNSRGEDTIEVEMSAGLFSVKASIPSGKSRGLNEAVVVDVDKAIDNIEKIITPQIVLREISDIYEFDKILLNLDGTENKSNLGANTILAMSIVFLRLEAKAKGESLWECIRDLSNSTIQEMVFPRLFVNLLNGGVHGNFNLPFQEYMLILGDGSSVVDFFNKLQEIFEKLGVVLKEKFDDVQMGDEGGYSFKSTGIEEPFEILKDLDLGGPSEIGIDVAAGEFYKDGVYEIADKKYSSEELLEIYKKLNEKFNLVSIEGPFAEKDTISFAKIMKEFDRDDLIVGDDLTTTNPETIKKAIEEKLVNAVIIKPNQIGTVSETLEAVRVAKESNLKIIVSHRSGETMDSFIADLAVGVGAYGIKAGAPSQPERMVKYERLVEIEREVKG